MDPQPVQRSLPTPDGRVLAVEEAGELDGIPVLVHNGTLNRIGETHAWLAGHF